MKCCYNVMCPELCCDASLLPAAFPQHSQHSIKFRREFRQNSAGAAATPARGWRGPGRRPRRQQCPPRRRRVARHPAAARPQRRGPGRQLQSYTSVPRQFTSFSYQTRQATRTRPELGRRPPPKCVQRKRAAAARRLDTGAWDCGTHTAPSTNVRVTSLMKSPLKVYLNCDTTEKLLKIIGGQKQANGKKSVAGNVVCVPPMSKPVWTLRTGTDVSALSLLPLHLRHLNCSHPSLLNVLKCFTK